MTSFRILSILLLSLSYVQASNFTVALYKCKGDTDVVMLDSATITCDGSEYCTWGSVAQVSGAFTIQEDLESSVAEVKAKAFGNKYFDDEIDICNYVQGPTIPEGLTCPAAGTYGYSTEFTLPEEAKKKWYHWFIKKSYYGKNEVKFDFEEIDAKVKCKFKVYAEGSEKKKGKKKKKSKKSSYDDDDEDYVTSAAALVIVGAAAAFGINKRRRIFTAGGLSDEMNDGEATSDFEMMGNKDSTIMVR
mmetsp:Transcript_7217/g.13713  ORF Transcript_7217/g.13713 Transcript_7217/m.13713 type:complete len:246 (+) Transcript_7217:113-850(+)